MYVKFPPEDLNPDPYPPHFTNTYTCRDVARQIILWASYDHMILSECANEIGFFS